jgi:hypothetical protein
MIDFKANRRYRIAYLPPGAKVTRTVEVNYLGTSWVEGEHEFDGRASTPPFGTARLHVDQIKEVEDIGPAIWERS